MAQCFFLMICEKKFPRTYISHKNVSEFKFFLKFNFIYKKNKIKIQIKDTRCTSEHKIYYFQQSCKRRLSFVILEDKRVKITSALKQVLREFEYVSK